MQLANRLLVATPGLLDENFWRSVIYIIEHGDDGAMGVILNRPTDLDAADILPEWRDAMYHPAVVFEGGPVQREAGLALARRGNDVVLVDFGDSVPDNERIRVFAGYAGWETDQLESEIAVDGWFVVDSEPDDPFTPNPEDLWRTVLRRQTGRLRWYANYPDHESFN